MNVCTFFFYRWLVHIAAHPAGVRGTGGFWLGHSWAGLRGGGGGAEQWECSIGTVRENLGWSRRVWSAPPLAHPAFVQLRKLSALPTDSNNKPSQLGSPKPVYCTSRQREAKSVTSPLHTLTHPYELLVKYKTYS